MITGFWKAFRGGKYCPLPPFLAMKKTEAEQYAVSAAVLAIALLFTLISSLRSIAKLFLREFRAVSF